MAIEFKAIETEEKVASKVVEIRINGTLVAEDYEIFR